MRNPGTVSAGVTAPRAFRAAGVASGIKRSGLDVAVVVSDVEATAAAVFTTNRVVAAPVIVSREHLASSGGVARAVVANSGCANACTGPGGFDVARHMAAEAARILECDPTHVLVASTGVIGVSLDAGLVGRGIEAALSAASADGHRDAAMAIMTTDPWAKEHAVRATLDGRPFVVGGMAKGSGMIEPRLATMLGFLTTDAAVPAPLLARALAEASDDTFNAITVDGEPSTNDSVFLLANGASGVTIDEAGYAAFVEALRSVSHELALEIVRGGEGATKLVEVSVTGARTRGDARLAARAIATSLLVKTAVHGGDPNWGRILAAAGRSGADLVLDRASVRIGDVVLFDAGAPFDERADQAAEHLAGARITLTLDLGTGGPASATVFTCDLSADYVRINAEYRT